LGKLIHAHTLAKRTEKERGYSLPKILLSDSLARLCHKLRELMTNANASRRQRLPAIPAVIALDLTFILRQSSMAVNRP